MTEYVYNDANGTLASVKHGEGRTLFKLITADEFRAMKESFPHHKEMLRSLGSVRYCKAEPYRDHIWLSNPASARCFFTRLCTVALLIL